MFDIRCGLIWPLLLELCRLEHGKTATPFASKLVAETHSSLTNHWSHRLLSGGFRLLGPRGVQPYHLRLCEWLHSWMTAPNATLVVLPLARFLSSMHCVIAVHNNKHALLAKRCPVFLCFGWCSWKGIDPIKLNTFRQWKLHLQTHLCEKFSIQLHLFRS